MPIYFIQEVPDGAIKIGYTGGDPFQRLSALQTGNSKPLKLLAFAPGSPQHERGLHERFAELRLHGEWFRADPRLLGFIDGMRWAFPEEQKRKPREAATLYGFTDDQIQFITGVVQGLAMGDTIADAEMVALGHVGLIQQSDLDVLIHAKYLVSEVNRPGAPPAKPVFDGRRIAASGRAVDSAVASIDEALSRHYAALAEQKLADDESECIDPSEMGATADLDAEVAYGTRADDDLLPHETH